MRSVAITTMLVLAGLVGCETDCPPTFISDRSLVYAYADEAVQNAVVAQRTIYPYHFETGSAELNELGQRDVSLLATHLRKTPGALNVRQGSADDVLYQARVATVGKALSDQGVDAQCVRIEDGFAGGDGVSSEDAIGARTRWLEGQRGGQYAGATSRPAGIGSVKP